MCILCGYWSSNGHNNFVFVWPLVTFSHTNDAFGGVFSHIQVSIKWPKVWISVTIWCLKWRNVCFVWLLNNQWPHDFFFVWPLVTFSHTNHVFGSEFSHIQLTIKWPIVLISVTICCLKWRNVYFMWLLIIHLPHEFGFSVAFGNI